MKKSRINLFKYDNLLDIYKLLDIYNRIKSNCKHKDKIFKFEMFQSSYITEVLGVLRSRKYKHGKYNIFIILEPKSRIIMSENMGDKIINHLLSHYVLFPLIEPMLIDANVATRTDKGTKAGIYYMKKYINSMKQKHDKFYVLKCDVSKFFYQIDHEILLEKLKGIIVDEDIYNLTEEIINSTNYSYLGETIKDLISKRKEYISKLKISENEKKLKYEELDRIPLYDFNKGLPIGNMSSQIFAIFYLNDLDHYIKEKLKIKCYIRYMDDLILIHEDKEYLKYCLEEIGKKMEEVRLSLNSKTQITEIHDGVSFLGYKFILKNNRLNMLISSKAKRRMNKKLKTIKRKERTEFLRRRYNGYLAYGDTRGFMHSKSWKKF